MKEDLIKSYVREVLKEGAFRRDEDDYVKKTKKRGIVGRIKSFFTGAALSDKVAEDWIERKEDYFDTDLEEIEKGLSDKIFDEAEKALKPARQKSKGRPEKIVKFIQGHLNKTFRGYFTALQREKNIQRREERVYDDYDY